MISTKINDLRKKKARVNTQLALDIKLNEDATLDNFCALPSLKEVLAVIQGKVNVAAQHQYLWLHGASCSGRSHLLQGACARVTGRAQFLPISQLISHSANDVLDDLSSLELIAMDDIHLIASNSDWEKAVFNTFNAAHSSGCRIIFSANQPASAIDFNLSDLRSRLSWSVSYHLPSLDDSDKAKVLSFRASRLGLELTHDVANYIVHRADRNMSNLVELLDVLDTASLKNNRSLTIPFVKEILDW